MPGSPEEITHLMKVHSSNTCLQSNLNWVMVRHHVTVPRQLTGGPLLCVRGVTCHMIDDTTGVQGLRVIASLNHFAWCTAGQPTCRAHAWTLVRTGTCIQIADNAHKNQQTHTITRTTAASCRSCSPGFFFLHERWQEVQKLNAREAGKSRGSFPD